MYDFYVLICLKICICARMCMFVCFFVSFLFLCICAPPRSAKLALGVLIGVNLGRPGGHCFGSCNPESHTA